SESSLKSYWTPNTESGRRWIGLPSEQAVNSLESHTQPERLSADRRLPADAFASGPTINRNTRTNIMDFPEHFEQIFKQLNSQRVHRQLCDCVIVVGSRHFKAHRAVLAACSTHFRALFSSSEGDGSVSVIQLDSDVVTAEAFSVLMDMMYTSTLTLGDSDITDVLMAATHLHVNTVVKACKHYLNTQTLPRSPRSECPSQSAEQQLSNNSNSFPSQHLGLSIISSALNIKSEDDGSPAGQEAGSVSGSGPEDEWCSVGEKQTFSLICSEAESSRDPSQVQGFEDDSEEGCSGGEERLPIDYERKGYRTTAAQEDVQLPSQSDSDRASSAEPLLLVVKEEYPDGDGVQVTGGAEDEEMKDGGR
ncbi:zinc finger and BTB domain-containing protein 5-like, partial [Clarias magur]